MKYIIIVLMAVFISACGGNKISIIDKTTGKSAIVTQISAKHYRKMINTNKAEETNQKYFEMKTAMFNRLDSGDVALVAAIEGLKNERTPTTYNDVQINGQNQTTEIVKVATGGLIDLGKVGGAAFVAGKAVENRDATVVEQAAPVVVQPEVVQIPTQIVEPTVVNPIVIQ